MCCWGLIARQDTPQPSAKASPFGAVWKAALFKISRQMQITHSADTMEQTYTCHCNFCFHFLILLPERSWGTHESFVSCKAKTTEQLCEKFLVFAQLLFKMQKLTDFWETVFLIFIYCLKFLQSRQSSFHVAWWKTLPLKRKKPNFIVLFPYFLHIVFNRDRSEFSPGSCDQG